MPILTSYLDTSLEIPEIHSSNSLILFFLANILDRRLQNKSTPGDYVAKLWDEKFNGSIRQTIFEVISDIWQRTRSNQPIM
jgi:hypothetical protein